MNRRIAIAACGLAVLALAWTGPLASAAHGGFAAHMLMHMAVVAIAAPLLALALSGTRFDPTDKGGVLFTPIPASVLELVAVWAWHAPALHEAAREAISFRIAEQGSFLLTGLILWLAAFGGRKDGTARRAAGVAGLLLTSMHMTLLGVLLAVTPRALYAGTHHGHGPFGPLQDQHLGGVIMLLVGGIAYLAGGLWLLAGLLRSGDRIAGRAE